MSQEMALPSLRDQVLSWLNQNQYTRASFDRIISHVMGASTYEQLRTLVHENADVFRSIIIKGGYEGLALVAESSAPSSPPSAPNAFMHLQNLVQHLESSISGPRDDHDLVYRTRAEEHIPPVYPTGDDWRDISTEEFREYLFRNGQTIRINQPLQLKVGETVEGRVGGPAHYVTTPDGIAHHISAGWLHLCWKTKPGKEIVNF